MINAKTPTFLLIFLLMVLATGCATTRSVMQSPSGVDHNQNVLDDRACKIYHGRFFDEGYYVACMSKRGYTLTTVTE